MKMLLSTCLVLVLASCLLPKAGDVKVKDSKVDTIDTRAEASTKKAEIDTARDITYNDYDPRMIGVAALVGFSLMLVFMNMDAPKESKIRLALGIMALVAAAGAITMVLLMSF